MVGTFEIILGNQIIQLFNTLLGKRCYGSITFKELWYMASKKVDIRSDIFSLIYTKKNFQLIINVLLKVIKPFIFQWIMGT